MADRGASERVVAAVTSALAFAATLVLYLVTLYPSIPGGDSGELVAESCRLGVGHPPGYPLYILLNHIITHDGDPASAAWRSNALNAVLGALAAACIALAYLRWTSGTRLRHPAAALAASLAFSTSPLTWTYSVGSEVFALNNFFAAALVWLAAERLVGGQAWAVPAGAFLSGLALCNQHTIILFEIPLIAAILWAEWPALTLWRLASLAQLGLLGLAPYAYLPLSQILRPHPGSWGDVASVAGFVHHLRRGDYGTFKLFSTGEDTESMAQRVAMYAADAAGRQGSIVGGVLFLAGAALLLAPITVSAPWVLRETRDTKAEPVEGKRVPAKRSGATAAKRRRGGASAKSPPPPSVVQIRFGRLLLATWAFYLIVFHTLANLPLKEELLQEVQSRFWMQPNIPAAMVAGLATSLAGPLPAIGAVGLVLARVPLIWREVDMSGATYMRQYAQAILEPLPPYSLLLLNYDMAWTAVRYAQECEGARSDVTSINLSMISYEWFASHAKRGYYPHLRFRGTKPRLRPSYARDGGFAFVDLLEDNLDAVEAQGGGVVLVGVLSNPRDAAHTERFDSIALGLGHRFFRKPGHELTNAAAYAKRRQRTWRVVARALPELPPPHPFGPRTWEWTVVREFWRSVERGAVVQLDLAMQQGKAVAQLADAAVALECFLANEDPDLLPLSVYKNLGLAYANLVRSPDRKAMAPALVLSLPRNLSDIPYLPRHAMVPERLAAVHEDPASVSDVMSRAVYDLWSHFIRDPEAREDSSFAAIADVVRSLEQAGRGK